MTEFTNKDMLKRVLEKLDNMDSKLQETHELAKITNGKVKFHTKIMWWFAGAGLGIFLSFLTWFLKSL